ncbi:Adenylate Kinase 7 [Manis pentadactyla]|nr:Adenylate Kinase 7 [Manis pentadactyla]
MLNTCFQIIRVFFLKKRFSQYLWKYSPDIMGICFCEEYLDLVIHSFLLGIGKDFEKRNIHYCACLHSSEMLQLLGWLQMTLKEEISQFEQRSLFLRQGMNKSTENYLHQHSNERQIPAINDDVLSCGY